MASIQRKLVHKQFNSPIGLYSPENVQETLKREMKAFGVQGITVDESSMKSFSNLANSAVLRAVEEEDQEMKCEYTSSRVEDDGRRKFQRQSRSRQRSWQRQPESSEEQNEQQLEEGHQIRPQTPLHQEQLRQIKTEYLNQRQNITIDRDTVLKINRLATRKHLRKREHSWPPADVADVGRSSIWEKSRRKYGDNSSQHVRSVSQDNAIQFDEVVCKGNGSINLIRDKFNKQPTRIIERDPRDRPAKSVKESRRQQVKEEAGKRQTIDSSSPTLTLTEPLSHPSLTEETKTTKMTRRDGIDLGYVKPMRQFYEQLGSSKCWLSYENINDECMKEETGRTGKPIPEPEPKPKPKRQSCSLERGREGAFKRMQLPPQKPRTPPVHDTGGQKLQRRTTQLNADLSIRYDLNAKEGNLGKPTAARTLPSKMMDEEMKPKEYIIPIDFEMKQDDHTKTNLPHLLTQYDDNCIYLRSIDQEDNTLAYIPAAITLVPSPDTELIQKLCEYGERKAEIRTSKKDCIDSRVKNAREIRKNSNEGNIKNASNRIRNEMDSCHRDRRMHYTDDKSTIQADGRGDISIMTAKYENFQQSISTHLREVETYIRNAKAALKATPIESPQALRNVGLWPQKSTLDGNLMYDKPLKQVLHKLNDLLQEGGESFKEICPHRMEDGILWQNLRIENLPIVEQVLMDLSHLAADLYAYETRKQLKLNAINGNELNKVKDVSRISSSMPLTVMMVPSVTDRNEEEKCSEGANKKLGTVSDVSVVSGLEQLSSKSGHAAAKSKRLICSKDGEDGKEKSILIMKNPCQIGKQDATEVVAKDDEMNERGKQRTISDILCKRQENHHQGYRESTVNQIIDTLKSECDKDNRNMPAVVCSGPTIMKQQVTQPTQENENENQEDKDKEYSISERTFHSNNAKILVELSKHSAGKASKNNKKMQSTPSSSLDAVNRKQQIISENSKMQKQKSPELKGRESGQCSPPDTYQAVYEVRSPYVTRRQISWEDIKDPTNSQMATPEDSKNSTEFVGTEKKIFKTVHHLQSTVERTSPTKFNERPSSRCLDKRADNMEQSIRKYPVSLIETGSQNATPFGLNVIDANRKSRTPSPLPSPSPSPSSSPATYFKSSIKPESLSSASKTSKSRKMNEMKSLPCRESSLNAKAPIDQNVLDEERSLVEKNGHMVTYVPQMDGHNVGLLVQTTLMVPPNIPAVIYNKHHGNVDDGEMADQNTSNHKMITSNDQQQQEHQERHDLMMKMERQEYQPQYHPAGMANLTCQSPPIAMSMTINRSFDNISPRPYITVEGYKRVAWPPQSEERVVREFTPQPLPQYQTSSTPTPASTSTAYQHPQHQAASAPLGRSPYRATSYDNYRQTSPYNLHEQQQQQASYSSIKTTAYPSPSSFNYQQQLSQASPYQTVGQAQQQYQPTPWTQYHHQQQQPQQPQQPQQQQQPWGQQKEGQNQKTQFIPAPFQHPTTQTSIIRDQTDYLRQDQRSYSPQEYRGGSPGIITLRKEAPVTQKPVPVFNSQPAATGLKGGMNMRGDLKWPPPEYKEAAARENEERRKIAKGPACRPRRVHRDYTAFFAKNALSHHYPSYKVPPGTQHIMA